MHHPTDRITHTTAFVTPVVEHWLEREIAQWFHPMNDRSDDPSHNERTLYLCYLYRETAQKAVSKFRQDRTPLARLFSLRLMFDALRVTSSLTTLPARRSSIVERSLMVWWVDGTIPPGGLIELFLFPASAPQLV